MSRLLCRKTLQDSVFGVLNDSGYQSPRFSLGQYRVTHRLWSVPWFDPVAESVTSLLPDTLFSLDLMQTFTGINIPNFLVNTWKVDHRVLISGKLLFYGYFPYDRQIIFHTDTHTEPFEPMYIRFGFINYFYLQ